jgi:hypothetical protein
MFIIRQIWGFIQCNEVMDLLRFDGEFKIDDILVTNIAICYDFLKVCKYVIIKWGLCGV